MWSMFVHYDFMKKGFQGSPFESSSEEFQLRMWDFSVLWEVEENSFGALSWWVFYKYACMFCLNAYMRLSVYLQGKGAGSYDVLG